MNASRHYYHACTKWLEDNFLFKSEKDFIAGMYKQMTGLYLKNNEEDFSFLDGMECDAWVISDEESLRNKLSYVYRNPVVARLGYTASGYRWGSARLQFSDIAEYEGILKKVGDLSVRSRQRIFESRLELPGHWRYMESGMIWPGDYVDYKRINTLFRTPAAFTYSLNMQVESDINVEMMNGRMSMPDGEAKFKRDELCSNLFGNQKVVDLNLDQRIKLASELRRRLKISTKQAARLVHVPLSDLRKILG